MNKKTTHLQRRSVWRFSAMLLVLLAICAVSRASPRKARFPGLQTESSAQSGVAKVDHEGTTTAVELSATLEFDSFAG